jgi:hypothetical protein
VPVVLSQENDGCPMSVVGNVKTFVAALCFMNIWAISELAKTFFFKFKQGFIYENAQKKVLENCNFCPGKSLKSP